MISRPPPPCRLSPQFSVALLLAVAASRSRQSRVSAPSPPPGNGVRGTTEACTRPAAHPAAPQPFPTSRGAAFSQESHVNSPTHSSQPHPAELQKPEEKEEFACGPLSPPPAALKKKIKSVAADVTLNESVRRKVLGLRIQCCTTRTVMTFRPKTLQPMFCFLWHYFTGKFGENRKPTLMTKTLFSPRLAKSSQGRHVNQSLPRTPAKSLHLKIAKAFTLILQECS